MLKLVVVGLISTFAYAEYSHPINEEIVTKIKQKATTWVPHEAHENPLRHLTNEQI